MSGSRTALPALDGPPRPAWFCYECAATFLEPKRNAEDRAVEGDAGLPVCPECGSAVVEERNPADDQGSAFISDYTAGRERDGSLPPSSSNQPEPATDMGDEQQGQTESSLLEEMFGPPRMYNNRPDGVRSRGSGQSGWRPGGSSGSGARSVSGLGGGRGATPAAYGQADFGGGGGGATTGGFGLGSGGGSDERAGLSAAGGLMGLMGELFNPQPIGGSRNSNSVGGSNGVRTFTFGAPGSGFAGGGASISFGGPNTLRRGVDGRVIDDGVRLGEGSARDRDPFADLNPFPMGRGRTLSGGPELARGVERHNGDPEWMYDIPFAGHDAGPSRHHGQSERGLHDAPDGFGGGRVAGEPQPPADLDEMIQALVGYMNGGPIQMGPGGFMPFQMLGAGGGAAGGGFRGNMGDYVFSQEGLDAVMERMTEAAGSSNAPPPASDLVIEGLPRVEMDEEMLEASPECTICQDDLKIEQQVLRIPCKHVFHEDCVVPWLKTNGTCPVCRFSLVPAEERENARRARNEDQNQLNNVPANPLEAVFRGIRTLVGGVGGDGDGDAASGPVEVPVTTLSETRRSEGHSDDREMPGSFPLGRIAQATERTHPIALSAPESTVTSDPQESGSAVSSSGVSGALHVNPSSGRPAATPPARSGDISAAPGALGLRTPITSPSATAGNPFSFFGRTLSNSQRPSSSSSTLETGPSAPSGNTTPAPVTPYPSAIPADYREMQARRESPRRAAEYGSDVNGRRESAGASGSAGMQEWENENQDVD